MAVMVRLFEVTPVTEGTASVAVGLVAPPMAYFKRVSELGALVPSQSSYCVLTVALKATDWSEAPELLTVMEPDLDPGRADEATLT